MRENMVYIINSLFTWLIKEAASYNYTLTYIKLVNPLQNGIHIIVLYIAVVLITAILSKVMPNH